jgi:urease accessory protein
MKRTGSWSCPSSAGETGRCSPTCTARRRCVLAGDRLAISVDVGVDAMAHVTTQAATKIHRMDAGCAVQSQCVYLAENAYLELLPGPVIPHRHSRFETRTDAVVADSAALLSAELLQPGRKHHGRGELFEYDRYSSALTVSRPDGTPLFSERLVVESRRQAGVMGTFDIVANVILVTPPRHAATICDQVVSGLTPLPAAWRGAVVFPTTLGLSTRCWGWKPSLSGRSCALSGNLVRREVAHAPVPASRPWGCWAS